MDVVVIRDGASRAQMTYLFLQLEHGAHVDAPYVEYYKVSELIWQPTKMDTGMICIDGELSAAGHETSSRLPKMHLGKTLPMSYERMHIKVQRGLLPTFVP